MDKYTGHYAEGMVFGKGYQRVRRAAKRMAADARNAGGSVMQLCGHRHGPLQVNRCEILGRS